MKTKKLFYDQWLLYSLLFGSVVSLSYFSRFLPIPSSYKTIGVFLFGPFLILFSLGVYQYFKREYNTAFNQCFLLCNALAGVTVAMMFVVQNLNGEYHQEILQDTSVEFTKSQIKTLMGATYTIQAGIGMVWDIFISLGTIFLGLEFFTRASSLKVMKIVGLVGIILSLTALIFNFYSWPKVNPQSIGLPDLGPFIGIWYLLPFSYMVYEYLKLKNRSKQNQ